MNTESSLGADSNVNEKEEVGLRASDPAPEMEQEQKMLTYQESVLLVLYYLEISEFPYMLRIHVPSIFYLKDKSSFFIISTWLNCPKGRQPSLHKTISLEFGLPGQIYRGHWKPVPLCKSLGAG